MESIELAIDIGGTKTLVSAFIEGSQEPLASKEFPTFPECGADDFLARLRSVCEGLTGSGQISRWGLCTAGAVDPDTGTLVWSPNLGWKNLKLFERLIPFLGTEGVIENDCNAAAFGEWAIRKDIHSLIYVTVSTGIGMGIVFGGDIFRGANGVAGEIGHTVVDPNGPLCTCGRHGCLQALSGGKGLEKIVKDSLNREIKTKEIIDRAKMNERFFSELVTRASRTLGRFLCNLIDSFDPELLVIGGNLGKNPYYFSSIERTIRDNHYQIHGKNFEVELSVAEPSPTILGTLLLSRKLKTH